MPQLTRRDLIASGLAAGLACHPAVKPKPSDHPVPQGQVPMRTLGSTGVKVSALGIGGYHLGIPTDASEAIRIVHRALDAGVTFFDNSWDYHGGESERRLGEALKGHRDQAFVMTKLDGRTRQSAAQQLDESLRRLAVETIDLLQIHEVIRAEDPQNVFREGGAIEAFTAARAAGKVRFIGFTGHKDPSIHLAMLDEADRHGFVFDTVQLPLNVLDHHFRSFERAVLPRLKEKKIGVLGMKPLADGKALKAGVAATECLRYAMSTGADVTITGCDSMGVLDQALQVAVKFEPMKPEERDALVQRTLEPAKDGKLEEFKTGHDHDSTMKHPEWLGLRG